MNSYTQSYVARLHGMYDSESRDLKLVTTWQYHISKMTAVLCVRYYVVSAVNEPRLAR